jgi:hypothetical protein
MFVPESSEAQYWGGRRKPGFLDNWAINGNVGLTSFFGDLSIYDSEITSKLTEESGPALGFIVTKYFNDKIGISGQLLSGSLKGENTTGTSFESSFIEYNFHVRLELINSFFPDNLTDFGINFYAGIGQFVFQTTKWEVVDGEQQEYIKDTGTPEFCYFVGTGFQYKFTPKVGVNLDMALRQAKNDYLDYTVKNGNNDYYTHLSFGVTYFIDSFKKTYKRGRGRYVRGKVHGRIPMRRRR